MKLKFLTLFTPLLISAGSSAIILEGTVVPEPTSAALLGLGGLALIGRRRR